MDSRNAPDAGRGAPLGLSRRATLVGLAGWGGAAALLPVAARAVTPALKLGAEQAFSFDALILHARRLAAEPYRAPSRRYAEQLHSIDFDAHWQIRYREEAALVPAGPDAPVHLFHPARFFPDPVRIHLVEGRVCREVRFDRALFTMPADSPAATLGFDPGFAGFRVMRPGMGPDWVSFLGASYFRTDGPARQYGLSARGIAMDTGLARPEEFPRFTAFWLGAPEDQGDHMTVWALLDGPSVAGAYRFGLRRGAEGEGHRTSVAARLFMRAGVERIGIAPLTSMYWFSERDRPGGEDWRPEVHDSDGLALATGAGERIWRPLGNPSRVTTTQYLDDNPRGFGLIQRDRAFAHYQDDGVFYDRRPSAWVRPVGDWGRGAVELVEIPTNDETMDNIVAYWTPAAQPVAGQALGYDYAIDWVARDPAPGEVARVVAVRQGRGGIPGQPIPAGEDKMVVDFEGSALAGLDARSGVEAMVDITGGRITTQSGAWPVVGTDRWRMVFDFTMEREEPVDIRAHLRLRDRALSETLLIRARTGRARHDER